MFREIEERPNSGREARAFQRIDLPAPEEFEVALGPLGEPPLYSMPINISRGGIQTRTGVGTFEGREGTECLIRLNDPRGRVVPDRATAWVRRVERSGGYFLVALEFTHPLHRISM